MSDLPVGWLALKMGDVVAYGKTEKAEPDEITSDAWILELEDIEKDTSKVLQQLTFQERQSKSTKNRFKKGDVLYGKLRPYLNKVIVAEQDGYCTTEIIPIRPNEIIYGKYLFYWLKNPIFLKYVDGISHGINMPRLGTVAGINAPIFLAPLNEQKRITDKLDILLARVDACRERLDRIPAILKRFRQSVLASATSGKLTTDWRESSDDGMQTVHVKEPYFHDVSAPKVWKTTTLGAECDFIGGSQPPKSTFRSISTPGFVRLIQIRDYKSDKFATYIPIELARRFCSADDVMIGRYGPPLFQILRGLEGAYNVALMKALPRTPNLDREYLFYMLKGSELLKFIEAGSDRTAGQDGIRKELLNDYPLFLPPLAEQAAIVRHVKALFDYAGRLEARYKLARTAVERLTPALLAKAFRGELVPQDPNDEPAAVLLERIQAAQTNSPSKKNATKKSNPGMNLFDA